MSTSANITAIPPLGTSTSIVEFAHPAQPYFCFQPMPSLTVTAEPLAAMVVLHDISKLPQDWDGYGGRPITAESCAHAYKFLAVAPKGMTAPEITPTSNGTITFEWVSSEGDALLEIGRTRYSGHIQLKGGPTIYLEGGLATMMEQQFATEQVLAVIKELLYVGVGPSSFAHSIQISQPIL